MCGIAGYLTTAGAASGHLALAMAERLESRGPDDHGSWASGPIALAHRRLSVLDLSPNGHQPMVSATGRYVLVLNGEIYNHLELRSGLSGVVWRGHSDTEVLLAAIQAWGLPATLQRLVGMFAFALWDCERRELILVRDRLGEKPLYYGRQREAFVFASELKAIAACPGWRGEVDRDALALYLRRGYVPVPRTIWRGVHKLPPGTYLTIPADASASMALAPVSYWRAAEVVGALPRGDLGEREAADELEAQLSNALAGQMVADVPLGAFLSGGVDSSVVVALMQARASRPVKTFTIGFAEPDYDEAANARAVARHLGTEHTELMLAPAEAMAVIPRLAEMYDEPFGDSSQIPTHLVAAMARRHVTVSLSGDGGDELFAGYNRHFVGRTLWRRASGLPRSLRAAAGRALHAIPPQAWDMVGRSLPLRMRQPALGDKVHKFADALPATDAHALYLGFVSQIRSPDALVIGGFEQPTWADGEAATFDAGVRGADFTERMMFRDLIGYLTDDILTKLDRAAMAVSLETRVPLLDHRLVQFAWSLPLHMKIRDGQGKWLLRQVLYRYVPAELIERPKQGFGIPLDSWLRGPLRDWAEGLLDASRLTREGFLEASPIRQKWREHLTGQRNWQHWLWNVLMFQAWRERWL